MKESSYLIVYDIDTTSDATVGNRSHTQVYNDLYAAIKGYGTWAKITESCWAVVSSKPAVQIRDEIAAVLRSCDKIFVVQSAHIAAWRNVLCSNEWLKEYI